MDANNGKIASPPEPSLKEKAAKGLFWGGISNIVQQGAGAIFFIAIARILSPDDYGLIGMLAIFTAIANALMDSGFTISLVNKKEIRYEDYNAVFWFSILVGIVIYVLLFFAAPLISHFYDKPELTDLSRLLFLSFLIGSAGIAHNAILLKKMMVKERAKIDILAVTASGACSLILALNGFAYWGLALQTVVYASIGVCFRWYYSPWRPAFKLDFTPLKTMIEFSFKLLLTNIFQHISNNVFSVLLGKFYSEKQVGYYTQGSKWVGLGSITVNGMINSIAQPVFIEVNEDKKHQLSVFRKMLRFGSFVSFPAILGFAFIGKEFILITIGEKWMESVLIFQVLCIWGAFSFLWSLYTFLIMSYNKSDVYLYVYIVVLSLQLVCIALVHPFGILPMVAVYVLCYLGGILIWHYFANKLIDIRLIDMLKDIMPYLGITLGCLGVAWLLTKSIENIWLLCIAKIVIVASLYFLSAKFSGSIILKESIEFLTRGIKKKRG